MKLRRHCQRCWSLLKGHEIPIWATAVFAVLLQTTVPILVLVMLMKWRRFAVAFEEGGHWWVTNTFLIVVLLNGILGTMSAVILKMALRRHAKGSRTAILLMLQLFFYFIAVYVGKGMAQTAEKLPGDIGILVVFFFAFYALFLSWASKPIWDRVVEDWQAQLYRRWFGADATQNANVKELS